MRIVLLVGIFFAVLVTCSHSNGQSNIGVWGLDSYDLPDFTYTGELPFEATLPSGKPAKTPNNPFFLMGNYRFQMFTYVSGEYEIFATDRVMSKFNAEHNDKKGSFATIEIDNELVELTGLNSIAADPNKTKRVFGTGVAEFTYNLSNAECKRTISVLPSERINQGISAFLLTVEIKNKDSKSIDISYTEGVEADYTLVTRQKFPKHLSYTTEIIIRAEQRGVIAQTRVKTGDPTLFPDPESISLFEGYPPILYMKLLGKDKIDLLYEQKHDISYMTGSFSRTIKPNESYQMQYIIGYAHYDIDKKIGVAQKVLTDKANKENNHKQQWTQSIDHFSKEPDTNLRRELMWHDYTLESMAIYSQFYGETHIPQGCIYDFAWGVSAAPRDHFQHGLAACYTNTELSKSIMRYILKRSGVNGKMPFVNIGYGVASSESYKTSDQQLFYFYMLSEYLRITNDYAFLLEEVPYYPVKDANSRTVLHSVEESFRYLRDIVGRGHHGLIKLWNSDWNDRVYYEIPAPYNIAVHSGESHMNTTMAASIIPKLVNQLELASDSGAEMLLHKPQISDLINGLTLYRNEVWQAFEQENGDRTFARRLYFNGKSYGEDNMFLEPQGYLLQVDEFDQQRKEKLYTEVKARILDSEKIGARQQEKAELNKNGFGIRENGGFWYALNGPLILGVAEFNKDEAWRLLKQQTLHNQSQQNPQYWTSYWNSFDSLDSSILESEGLHDQSDWCNYMTSYCAHVHAWTLYCYKVLSED